MSTLVVEAIPLDGWKPGAVAWFPSLFGCEPVDSLESGISKANASSKRDFMVLGKMIRGREMARAMMTMIMMTMVVVMTMMLVMTMMMTVLVMRMVHFCHATPSSLYLYVRNRWAKCPPPLIGKAIRTSNPEVVFLSPRSHTWMDAYGVK